MNPEDFLDTASDLLLQNKREADLRTCIGRGYYAIYHMLIQKLLADLPLSLLQAGGLGGKGRIGHDPLVTVLKASGDLRLKMIGSLLENLKVARHQADYNLRSPLPLAKATLEVENAN